MRPALLALLLVLRLAAQQPPPFDRYTPNQLQAPNPAAIFVHGGDLTSGSRSDPASLHLARLLSQAGVLVFAMDYRLAPANPYPSAVEDVITMTRWLQVNASGQSVDPHRVVLIGVGVGAYLVNMAAVQGTPVAAAVSIAGWSDFRNQPITPNLSAFLGSTPIETASPAMRLTGNEPPFLLIHGDRDETVPLSQSLHFQAALHAVRVPCSLLILEGGGHDPLMWENLPTPRPWEREMLEWLQKVLQKPR